MAGKLNKIGKVYQFYCKRIMHTALCKNQTNPAIYDEMFGDKCMLKVIPAKCTPVYQPLDRYFFQQLKYFVKRIIFYVALETLDDLTRRNSILKIIALVHHQLGADVFQDMIKYVWSS